KANSLAGKFSAKEAVSKALGTGIRGFSFKDIEILKDNPGKPYVILKNNAEKLASSFGNYSISISISHSRENAVAVAILEVI
ncbi:MAG: holo-ACP synthase, partial [Clostridiaceae bacterium]